MPGIPAGQDRAVEQALFYCSVHMHSSLANQSNLPLHLTVRRYRFRQSDVEWYPIFESNVAEKNKSQPAFAGPCPSGRRSNRLRLDVFSIPRAGLFRAPTFRIDSISNLLSYGYLYSRTGTKSDLARLCMNQQGLIACVDVDGKSA